MFCPECGTKNNQDSAFCKKCGAPLSILQEEGPQQTQKQEHGGDTRANKREENVAGNEKLGPYILRGELGSGAMARVWLAYDANLDVERAIKEPMFDPSLSDDVLEEMTRRFVAEGKAAAKLNHPNIVTIHAADVYDGRPVIVMERMGETLADRLERGRMDPHDALAVLDQLLDAVGYAHKHGVVHRDIKPENIFIMEDGRAKLADFGIAHVESTNATHATMVGTVLGTPGYMSPEQAQGKAVDGRSDLFSIGVVAYEMFTGKNPFGAGDGSDSTTLIYRIVHEPAPELPVSIASNLADDPRMAIMAALAKDPNARPQSAESFRAALHGATLPLSAASSQSFDSSYKPKVSPSGALPTWMPYAAVAVVLVGVLAGIFAASNTGGGAASVGGQASESAISANINASSNSTPTSAAVESYLISAYNGFVAIVPVSRPSEPYQITNLAIEDLDAETAARVGAGMSASTVEDAQNTINVLQEQVNKNKEAQAAKEAEQKAAEEAERKRQEEEAATAAAKKAQDDADKAARIVASMEGWWKMTGHDPYVYIGNGAWDIFPVGYPYDNSSVNHFRTLYADQLERHDNGLPGFFEGKPGYYIYSTDPASLGYYLLDEDFDADGRIDVIYHAAPDGGQHDEGQNITRVSPPSWA